MEDLIELPDIPPYIFLKDLYLLGEDANFYYRMLALLNGPFKGMKIIEYDRVTVEVIPNIE